jgi:propanol-preferring alcohol dehydrogenase
MKAFVLERVADLRVEPSPLVLREYPVPVPGRSDVLIRVGACGVCHTEIDEIEGRVPARLPVIPGHQVVGRVEDMGRDATRFSKGDRVGVAWIFSACGHCGFCSTGLENLCPDFRGTGVHADGGYAEYIVVSENFAHPVPDLFSDHEAAPLLCAGAIGYRSLSLTGLEDGDSLGLTGFGGSAHLVLQMVRFRFPRTRVFVFARNPAEQDFAVELGAFWAGDISTPSPEPLRAVIDTTPVWSPVVAALEKLAPGGRLIINAIRKENRDRDALLKIDYARHLWVEREIKSVANVTREDVTRFLQLAAGIRLRPHVEIYPFAEANRALLDLKSRKIRGAKVLRFA